MLFNLSIICIVYIIIHVILHIHVYVCIYTCTYTYICIYIHAYIYVCIWTSLLLFQFGNQQEPPQPFSQSITRTKSFTSSNPTSMSDNKTNRYIPPGATCVLPPPVAPRPKKTKVCTL